VRRAVGTVLVFVFDIANTSLGSAGTGLYRKTSSFWTVALAGACLFRRQKNQSETMKAMNAIPPPPTMAPKLGVVEGEVVAVVDGGGVLVLLLVVVLVGVLRVIDWDEPEVGGIGVPLAETGLEELLDTVEDVLKLVLATEVLKKVVSGRKIWPGPLKINKGISISHGEGLTEDGVGDDSILPGSGVTTASGTGSARTLPAIMAKMKKGWVTLAEKRINGYGVQVAPVQNVRD
jgi:hypothetical protein